MSEDENQTDSTQSEIQEEDPRIRRAKQLARTVCICKGINLGSVLKHLDKCETVADVNRRAGTGSGGCQGQRCGPRIRVLLKKQEEARKKKKDQNKDSQES